MGVEEREEGLLRSVALQNANSIQLARQRAEQELLEAKRSLEKKTEELAHSLGMMRATLESTTDGILATDANARITGFNRKFVEMWNLPSDLLEAGFHLGLIDHVKELVANPDQFAARVREIYATSPPESFDLLELKDGRFLERFSRIQFVEQRNVGRVWSFRDVTSRQRLEEMRFRLAAIVESSDDAIVSKRLDGTIITWNAGAERMFGYRADEIIGKPVTTLIPSDRLNEETTIISRLKKGERIDHFESVRVKKDGSLIDVSLTISPVHDAQGRIVGASKIARDISERKKAEESLRRSEERSRTIFDTTGVSLWEEDFSAVRDAINELKARGVKDFKAYFREHPEFVQKALGLIRVLDVNKSTVQMFEAKDKAEFLGSLPEIFVPESMPVFVGELLALAEGQKRYEAEALLKTLRGNPIHILFTMVLPDSSESVQRALFSVFDVTARKQAEGGLRESEALKAGIMEAALDCLITMDYRGRVVDFNPAAERTFGYAREDALGKTVAELIVPFRLQDAHWAGLDRFLKTGKSTILGKRLELPGRCADGREIPVELAISVIELAGRKPFFTAYLRDITERIRHQEALRQSEEKYRLMVSQVKDYAIFSVDPQGIITSWDQGCKSVLGYDRNEFIGMDGRRLFTPEDVAGNVPEIELRTAAENKSASDDRWMLRKGKQRFWCMGITTAIKDESGNLIGFSKVMRDQTALHEAEQEKTQLLEAERIARTAAERISVMKDEFLANVSHELRTPLNSILGWSQLISSKKLSKEDFDQGLETIQRNARAQAQLIEDLLDMSRIVSGKVRLDVQQIDLATVVDGAINSVRPSAEAKGIRLRQIVDPLVGPVTGDPTRLQQVVWNLLSNAIKFTPRGGKVEVLLQRVNSQLEITVSDSGQGIKADFLPHVFERFRQADSSTTRMYGGLGLGLAIVKQLVELHGGTVAATSQGEGLGATFTVSLPLAPLRPSSQKREHPATPTHTLSDCHGVDIAGVRILIVDDEPDARDIIKRMLVECHAEVVTASNAAEGVEFVKSFRPDLILSDIGMPGTDGYDFIRQVRRLPASSGGRTPAGALTAFARTEDRTRAMIAGYQIHIAKPIEPQELLAAVASLAGRMEKIDD